MLLLTSPNTGVFRGSWRIPIRRSARKGQKPAKMRISAFCGPAVGVFAAASAAYSLEKAFQSFRARGLIELSAASCLLAVSHTAIAL